jgi:hypothetical protein
LDNPKAIDLMNGNYVYYRSIHMLTGWKLSVLGIIIVGITGIAASLYGLIEPGRAIGLFVVFVLFIGALELMERIRNRRKKRGEVQSSNRG